MPAANAATVGIEPFAIRLIGTTLFALLVIGIVGIVKSRFIGKCAARIG